MRCEGEKGPTVKSAYNNVIERFVRGMKTDFGGSQIRVVVSDLPDQFHIQSGNRRELKGHRGVE